MNKFLLATAAAFCSFAAVAQTPAPGQAVATAANMKNDDKPRTAAEKARQEALKDQRKADEQREKAGDKLRKDEYKDRSEALKDQRKADEQREKATDKFSKDAAKDREESLEREHKIAREVAKRDKPMKPEHSARGEHAHGTHANYGKHLGDHAGGGKGHK